MARIIRLIEAALILAAALPAAVLIWRHGVNVPFWDQWELVTTLASMHNGTVMVGKIFAQHNEHRMVFPKVIMLLLAMLSDWNIRVELAANIALALATLLVLLSMQRPVLAGAGLSTRLWLPFFAAATVFSLGQWENWLWGWQIQWFLSILAASGACALLARAMAAPNPLPWVAGAVGATIVCQFSIASGVMLWPAGLLLILLHPRADRFGAALAWLLAGAVSSGVFFWGYLTQAAHPSLLTGLANPGAFIVYLGNYLAGPLYKSWALGLGIGGAFAAAAAALMLRPGHERIPFLPWISLGIFGLATAGLTAIGRVGFGAAQGLSSRYSTIALLVLISLVPLAVFWLGLIQHRILRTGIGTLGAVGLTVLLAWGNMQSLPAFAEARDSRLAALDCLLMYREATDGCLAKLYPDPRVVRDRAAMLEKMRWSGFAASAERNRDATTVTLATDGATRIWTVLPAHSKSGWLDRVTTEDGVRAAGWARHPAGNEGRPRHVIVAAGGRIVGQTTLGIERPDVSAHYRDLDLRRSGWVATLDGWRPTLGQPVLRAYLVLADGVLLALNGEGR
jgi:hypothetical protein